MQYDAITLDTNIFVEDGLRLESGLLAQMSQFKSGSAKFVLSEIVLREIAKKLQERAADARKDLKKAFRSGFTAGILNTEASAALQKIYEEATGESGAAESRLTQYKNTTGFEVISAKDVAVADLVEMYFGSKPPFELSEAKKAEFPDAIALISLGAWAKAHGLKVLAISKDGGWKRFAEGVEHLDVADDLGAALASFQKHTEEAQKYVEDLLAALCRDELPELMEQVTAAIEREVEAWTPYPEASAAFLWEIDQVDLALTDFSFKLGDVVLVNVGREEIVAKVGVEISVSADASYSLSVRDSIDKDYVSLGGGSVEVPIDFQASALVTILGPVGAKPDEIDIDSVELVDLPKSIELGELDINRYSYEE